jgi:hypothetical protein
MTCIAMHSSVSLKHPASCSRVIFLLTGFLFFFVPFYHRKKQVQIIVGYQVRRNNYYLLTLQPRSVHVQQVQCR